MKIQRKPHWLRKKVSTGNQAAMRGFLSELRLNTVCQQARCPNMSECFGCGQATFLILGRDCTRRCSFCHVDKASHLHPPDNDEPRRVAEAVVRLNLSHVVITSPTRDDLADGGASHYAATVAAIRGRAPDTAIELLVPDFGGDEQAVQTVLSAQPTILAHNLETVPRLYTIRAGADYRRSLELLKRAAAWPGGPITKSGMMVGLGEHETELWDVMRDLRSVGCSYLSIGQYLAPSKKHHPVVAYLEPERFEVLRQKALELGFRHVESGPYVRSSYHAARYL